MAGVNPGMPGRAWRAVRLVAQALAAIALLCPGSAQASGAAGDTTKAVINAPVMAVQCRPVTLDATQSVLDPNAVFTQIAWNTGSGAFGPQMTLPLPVAGVPNGLGFGPPGNEGMTDSVTFAEPGTYNVGVELTDTYYPNYPSNLLNPQHNTTTATTTINVTPSSTPATPVPVFTASPTVIYAGRSISFDASASYEGSLVQPNCSSPLTPQISHQVGGYTWSFGDGSSAVAAAAAVSHTFTTPGTYNVVLIVASTDPAGGIASATHSVTVLPVPTAAPAPPPAPLTPGSVTLPSGKVKVSATGVFSLPVRCQAGSAGCVGELQVTSRRQDVLSTLIFASGQFSIPAGRSSVVKLRLSGEGRKQLKATHSKGLLAGLSAFPPGGNVTVQPGSSTIRLVPATAVRKPRRPSRPHHPARPRRRSVHPHH